MNAIRSFHFVLRRVLPIAAFVGTMLLAPAPSSALPTVNTVASGLSSPSALAIDGDYIYFGQQSGATGTLHRVSRAGSDGNPLPPLASGAVLFESGFFRAIDRIKFDTTHVFYGFGGYTNYQITKVPKDGGIPGNPIAQLGAPLLGVIGSDVFYARNFCCINKVTNFGAGTTTTVLPNALAPASLWVRNFAIDGTNIYFQHYFTRDVYRFDTVSGIPTPLITGNPVEGALFVDTTNVYLHRGTSIVKVPKMGGAVSTVHTGSITQLHAAQNGKVYYTENGDLYKVPADVDTPTLLVPAVSIASATIDGDSFYWADTTGGISQSKILSINISGWLWPIQGTDTRATITQDYGEFRSVPSTRNESKFTDHHTGFDIGVIAGTPVVATGDGTVVLIQRSRAPDNLPESPTRCKNISTLQETGNCGDHGNGNTIILQHRIGSQMFIYSQYQHLLQDPQRSAFESALEIAVMAQCAPETPSGTIICPRDVNGDYPVFVKAGDPIGLSGRSGNGVPDVYRPHLHFEFKSFATLGAYRPSSKKFEYGYTHDLPKDSGYIDPSDLLDGVSDLSGRQIVKVVGPPPKRIGPRRDYSCGLLKSSPCTDVVDERFIAFREAPPTPDTGCSLGWYQIVRVTRDLSLARQPGAYFERGDLSRDGFNPDGWICKGDSGVEWVTAVRFGNFNVGDVNNNGVVDQIDLDMIHDAIPLNVSKQCRLPSLVAGSTDLRDLDGDKRIDWQDLKIAERLCSPNCTTAQWLDSTWPQCPQ